MLYFSAGASLQLVPNSEFTILSLSHLSHPSYLSYLSYPSHNSYFPSHYLERIIGFSHFVFY